MNEHKRKEDEIAEVFAKIQEWERENPEATLTEIEEAVDAELAELRKALIERVANKGKEGAPEKVSCPRCGQGMMKNGQKKRELKSKGGEKITIEREQMRCHQCGMTFFPPG